jgi:hypothetical protein
MNIARLPELFFERSVSVLHYCSNQFRSYATTAISFGGNYCFFAIAFALRSSDLKRIDGTA